MNGLRMQSSAKIRSNMCKSQLLTCNIHDERVLEAINLVHREDFVPEIYAASAYVDEEIPLCMGRYMIEPLVFCQLLELAEVSPQDRVLDIGCGLGYSSAVLSHLAKKVVALEEHLELVNEARKRLAKYGRENVEVVTSPLMGGVPTQGPYNIIFIGGAIQVIPARLLEQLAEGGRLVSVESVAVRPDARSGLGRLLKITRHNGHFSRMLGHDAAVPLCPGFEKRSTFEF